MEVLQISYASFHQKQLWLLKQLERIQQPWGSGHVRLDLRRHQLLADSFTSLMELEGAHLHQLLRLQFLGEPGVDAGGVEREWFTVAVQELLDPNQGLFRPVGPLEALDINPASGAFNDLDKAYFRFAGRLLGKALMEHQIVPARLAPYLFKHLLGRPLGLHDLEAVDEQLHRSLCWLLENDGADALELTFSVTGDGAPGGAQVVTELDPGGAERLVTDENKEEFVALRVRHRLLDAVAAQLWHLRYGFHEIIPSFMVTVFDAAEFELLLCGLPGIDLADWQRHTEYGGDFAARGASHRVIRWFWEVVESLSVADRFRLLQFATGSARVPARGFKALQSNDGNFRKFNIVSYRSKDMLYPRSHSCFNKLDLPVYRNKQTCELYIRAVLQTPPTGFTMD